MWRTGAESYKPLYLICEAAIVAYESTLFSIYGLIKCGCILKCPAQPFYERSGSRKCLLTIVPVPASLDLRHLRNNVVGKAVEYLFQIKECTVQLNLTLLRIELWRKIKRN